MDKEWTDGWMGVWCVAGADNNFSKCHQYHLSYMCFCHHNYMPICDFPMDQKLLSIAGFPLKYIMDGNHTLRTLAKENVHFCASIHYCHANIIIIIPLQKKKTQLADIIKEQN